MAVEAVKTAEKSLDLARNAGRVADVYSANIFARQALSVLESFRAYPPADALYDYVTAWSGFNDIRSALFVTTEYQAHNIAQGYANLAAGKRDLDLVRQWGAVSASANEVAEWEDRSFEIDVMAARAAVVEYTVLGIGMSPFGRDLFGRAEGLYDAALEHFRSHNAQQYLETCIHAARLARILGNGDRVNSLLADANMTLPILVMEQPRRQEEWETLMEIRTREIRDYSDEDFARDIYYAP